MDYFFPFLVFCIVTTITPGPNNIMIMTSGLNYGIKQSLPHYLGIIVGFPLMVFLVGYGLGDIIARHPMIHHALDVVGISYLLYLAWKVANTGNPKARDSGQKPLNLMQSLGFQWVNVKAWIMIVAAVAAYTSPDNFLAELMIITACFFVVGIVNSSSWLFLGSYLTTFIKNEKQMRVFNVSMALLLVVSVIPIILKEIENMTI